MACHVRKLPYLPSYPDFCTAQFQGLFSRITRQTAAGGQLCARRHVLNYRISIAVEQADTGFNPSVKKKKIQQDCRTGPSAQGESIRIRGCPCDHWLLKRRCSFSTAIPGTAPKRHTSPAHRDAGSQLSPATSKWLICPSDCKIATWKHSPHTSPLSRREDKVHHSRQGTILTNNRFKNCSASQRSNWDY